jgi:hypothetical protein
MAGNYVLNILFLGTPFQDEISFIVYPGPIVCNITHIAPPANLTVGLTNTVNISSLDVYLLPNYTNEINFDKK